MKEKTSSYKSMNYKLLESLKTKNISLPDEFIYELLIERLSKSLIDYKQQLKHRHKEMSLSDLITHFIIEDTNRKESVAARTKAMPATENMIKDKLFHKGDVNKNDHNNKKKYKHNNLCIAPSNPIPCALVIVCFKSIRP